MIDYFEGVLRELGAQYGITLHPDKRGLCKLLIKGFHIQIEPSPEYQALLIATFIHDLLPGKFRENILKAALKINHATPEGALLAYSDKNNELALFQYISLSSLTGKLLSEHLTLFIKKAEEWKTAIDTGALLPLLSTLPQEGSSGLFGLTR